MAPDDSRRLRMAPEALMTAKAAGETIHKGINPARPQLVITLKFLSIYYVGFWIWDFGIWDF